ncbi:MAG: acyltransferase [Polyangiaceae bacterium]
MGPHCDAMRDNHGALASTGTRSTLSAHGSPPASIASLTSLRFFAALHVVFLHYFPRTSVWVSHGYLGVSFFYTLSGFILTYTYWTRRTTYAAFLRARFARVYPMYFVAWGLAAIPVCVHRFAVDAPWTALVKLGVSGTLSAFLLQAWVPSLSASWNPPAWSVSCEFSFYLCFPALLGLFRKSPRLWIGVAAAYWLFTEGVLVFLGMRHPTWFAVLKFLPLAHIQEFLVGVASYGLYVQMPKPWRLPFEFWAAFLAVVLSFPHVAWFPAMHNGLLAPVFGLMILSLAWRRAWTIALLDRKELRLLGEASYSIYILQSPICYLFGLLHAIDSMALFALFVVVLTALAIACFFLVERPMRARIRGGTVTG